MEQLSLFDSQEAYNPLASRMRPEDLDEFVGQEHLLGKGKVLRQLIEQDGGLRGWERPRWPGLSPTKPIPGL